VVDAEREPVAAAGIAQVAMVSGPQSSERRFIAISILFIGQR
jgi:hypothetical protein